MKISLGWLRDYVDLTIKTDELAEKLTMAGLEVTSIYKFGKEIIFDIEVTPNRRDCFSIIGIAREVAAITQKKLKLPKKLPHPRGVGGEKIKIEIKDKPGCSRYIGRMIANLKITSSPAWVKNRLNALGIRAVNNVVDITNYCLLESGQPLHAFDYDKLAGGRIIVRRAVKGEEITTIDGVKRALDEGVLVIADKLKPVAIAGVMGGKETEVTEETKRILLESAYFDPVTVRRGSQQLGLATESSCRFERGVNRENVFFAGKRARELITQFAGGKEEAVTDVPKLKKQKKAIVINFPLRLVDHTLGMPIPESRVKEILRALEFTVCRGNRKTSRKAGLNDELKVTVPFFREDVTRPIDLVEELARIYGYDKIPATMPSSVVRIPSAAYRSKGGIENKIKEVLTGLGFNEVVSFSLISKNLLMKMNLTEAEVIAVENPISYEQEIMRPTLIPGLLDIAAWNFNRQAEKVKIFELSSVYLNRAEGFVERKHLAFAISGIGFEDWVRKVKTEANFFDLKGALETLLERLGVEEYEIKAIESPFLCPGKAAALILEGRPCLPAGREEVGLLGAVKENVREEFGISNDVYLCEINFDRLLPRITKNRKFHRIPKQPSVLRDIALIVKDGVSSRMITSIIKKKGGDTISKIKFFDQYAGEQIPPGFRSLAYSIEYQAKQKTLEDSEVNEIHALICQELNRELGAQVR